MLKEIECIITGRVQMVMFRDFAKRKADKLGVYGMVENSSDGSVRVVAQGDEEKLNKFIELLKTGPMFAKVGGVSVRWKEVGGKFTDFKILWK